MGPIAYKALRLAMKALSLINDVQASIGFLKTQISSTTAATATVTSSNASPEGAITAIVGSLHTRLDQGQLWVKETGSGNTGWTQLIA